MLALLAQLTGAAFTAGLTIFLARKLGSHGYGILTLGLGITGLVLVPSDFGISHAVARFVAEHFGDRPRITAVLADGLRLKFLAAVCVAGILAVSAEPIATAYGFPGLAWPIRGLALALLCQSVMLIGVVFTALRRVDLSLKTAVAESVTETIAGIALVLAGAGATGAAFGRALGYLVGVAATLVLLVRVLGPGVIPRSLRFGAETKRIASYAGVLLIVSGAYTAFNEIDVLIIGAYAGVSSVAFFSAPMKLAAFLTYPGSAVSWGVAPRVARNSGAAPDTRAFVGALRLLLIGQAAVTAFVLGWAGLAVEIALGSRYRESASVLRALAPYVYLSGFGVLVSVAVNYLGQARRRIPLAIGAVVINVVVDLLLVPRLGAIGGAIGTDAAYALYAPGHLYICVRVLGLDLRSVLLTFLRAALAGAAMTGVLLLFGGDLAHLWMSAAGGILGSLVFCLVLWVTREVSVGEVRSLLTALPTGMRRMRLQGAESR